MSEYLWDRSGPPDLEVERLERILGALKHSGVRPVPQRRRVRRYLGRAAAAAAVIVSAIALQLTPSQMVHTSMVHTSWIVTAVDAPEAGRLSRGMALGPGQSFRTPAGGKVTLEAEDFGRIEVGPESELRVLPAAVGRQSVSLPRGSIHALIWAPPRRFSVHTPSALAIDLGCEYTLTVADDGSGLLRVHTGWVAFQDADRESFIPAGAACATVKGSGPATPYFEDAATEFRRALAAFDRGGESAALHRVLELARPRDGLTLWHLLRRAPVRERGAVFDRYSDLVPIPSGVTRMGVAAGNEDMLDACWNALGLDSAEWWREWKRDWRE